MVVAESRAACNLAVECRKGVIPLACNMMRCRRFSTGFFSAVLEVAGRSMRSDVVRAKFDADHWFIHSVRRCVYRCRLALLILYDRTILQ